MYQASVPRLINALTNLSNVLQKAHDHMTEKKIDANAILHYRLYPDMLNFTRQIQIAADTAKGVVARLAGVDIPVNDDTETSIAELQERLAKTIAFIGSFKPEQIDGTEDKAIVTKRGDKETHYKGMQFLLNHAMPNIYFHVTTVYTILRHNGIEIGKRDYLGKVWADAFLPLPFRKGASARTAKKLHFEKYKQHALTPENKKAR